MLLLLLFGKFVKGYCRIFMYPSSVPTANEFISKRFERIWHKDKAGWISW